MRATPLTRRRALALGALAGLGALARPGPAPALAARAPARPRGFGMDVGPRDFHGTHSRVLRAPRRFDLLGVRALAAVDGRLDVRVRRRGGRWSPWVPLAVHGDHGPDTYSSRPPARASDPVWAGRSDELQLRVRGGAVRERLRVHFVAVPRADRRRRLWARSAAAHTQSQPQPGTPPPIIPRSSWGGDQVPPRRPPQYGTVELAFVHHTVTANDYQPQDSAGIVLAIAKYHRDTNGWNDIGYNFLVDKYGQVFEGRLGGVDQAVVGAQAQGYNSVSTGIANLGTFESVGQTDAAMQTLAQLIGWKLSLHGVPCEGTVVVRSNGGSDNRYEAGTRVTLNRISGHRDGDATSCPGDALYGQIPALRPRAAALAGPVVPRAIVTLTLPAQPPAYGDDAMFSGTVINPDGTAGAGQVVAVQKRGPSGSWVTIARTTAAPDGSFAVGTAWRRAADVRARTATAASVPATLGIVPQLAAQAAARHVPAGGSAVLTGRVRPSSPVAVLVEMRGRDGAWRRVATLRARVRGTGFSARVRLRRAGLYRLTPATGAGSAPAAAAAQYVRAVRVTGGAAGV
ncbi:MAG TPA: peptidoglycan recognition protein [Solirubrobacteraceae bacterium]|nr:peptidoglycan recognition protein [Solirubrobacteraceae bacterium]